jgi:phenylalanyl-tRNA synthetase beta subunit
LQDKLHQNLCRQRTLVAIGTHDLATIKVCTCLIEQLSCLSCPGGSSCKQSPSSLLLASATGPIHV